MNFRQLSCFVAVVDEGSFPRAARAIGIAQPSLSQHIRALEEELNGRLIERLPRGIALTPAGRSLLPEARAAVRAVERGRQGARAALALESGGMGGAAALSPARAPRRASGRCPLRGWDGPLQTVAWEEFVSVVPRADPLADRSSVRLED